MNINEVTMYKVGNQVFETPELAAKYQEKLLKTAAMLSLLKPVPDTTTYANGGGFVQQDPLKVEMYKREILLAASHFNPKFRELALNPMKVDPSGIVGREIGDSDPELFNLWHRLMCMDSQYREWGQVYYAINPSEGSQYEAQVKG